MKHTLCLVLRLQLTNMKHTHTLNINYNRIIQSKLSYTLCALASKVDQ
jgi:hypothetical protein